MEREDFYSRYESFIKRHHKNYGLEERDGRTKLTVELLVYYTNKFLDVTEFRTNDIISILFNDNSILKLRKDVNELELHRFRVFFQSFYQTKTTVHLFDKYHALIKKEEASALKDYPFLFHQARPDTEITILEEDTPFDKERKKLLDSFFYEEDLFTPKKQVLKFPSITKQDEKQDCILKYQSNTSKFKKSYSKEEKMLQKQMSMKKGKVAGYLEKKLLSEDVAMSETSFRFMRKKKSNLPIPTFRTTEPEFRKLLDEIGKEMDTVTSGKSLPKSHTRSYWKEQQNLFLHPVIKSNDLLDFNKSFSYQSFMGKGKSTIMMILTYWLTKKLEKKVAIFTRDTKETLETVVKLRTLGIKAVPIIGTTNQRMHFETYSKGINMTEIRKYPDYEKIVFDVMAYSGGQCIAKAIADDNSDGEKPCFKMLYSEKGEKEQKVTCPFFNKCSVFKRDQDLLEAEVWVGHPTAVTLSMPSWIVEPYKRTYLQLMVKECDVIFADESDAVLDIFEENFISKSNLIERPHNLFSDATNFVYMLKSLRTSQILDIEDPSLFDFGMFGRLGEDAVQRLLKLFRMRPEWIEKYDGQSLHSTVFLKKIYKNGRFFVNGEKITLNEFSQHFRNIFEDSPENRMQQHFENIKITVGSLCRESTDEDEIYEELEHITEKLFNTYLADEFKGRLALEDLLCGVDGKNDQETVINARYEFISYFIFKVIEYCYQRIVYLIPIMLNTYKKEMDELNVKFDNVLNATSIARYTPYITRSLLVSNVQFIYEKPKQKQLEAGKLTVVSNSSIGRELFLHLSDIPFEQGEKNASVVYMSASSYAPDSAHFDVRIPTKFILENKRVNRAQIIQRIIRLKEQPFISGSGDKEESLKKQIRELLPHIQEGLNEHEHKTMLIVNSYTQAKELSNEIRMLDFSLKVKVLSSKEQSNPMFVTSANLHTLNKDNVDIFIVPLLTINRGYNILMDDGDNGKESLFKNFYLLVRPLMMTEYNEIIKIINASKDKLIQGAISGEEEEYYNGKAYQRLKNAVDNMIKDLLDGTETWYSTTQSNRELARIAAWYVFVNLFQMIGRGLRGNNPISYVYYVDAKFVSNLGEYPDTGYAKDSLLWFIEQNLKKAREQDPVVFEELYAPYFESLVKLCETKRKSFIPA